MLPSGSLATLDTWPSVHPLGMCGQDGSTTNFGTSTMDAGRGGAAEVRHNPAIANATTATPTMPALTYNFLFAFIILSLLCGSSPDCSDSIGSTLFNRNFRIRPLARASYASTCLRHNQFAAGQRTGRSQGP